MTTQAVWRLRESIRLTARGSFLRYGPNNKFHELLRWPSADGDFGKFRPFAFLVDPQPLTSCLSR
jgi:hypothetical protein